MKKGDRRGIRKKLSEWAVTYLATLYAGAVVIPIDYGLHDHE